MSVDADVSEAMAERVRVAHAAGTPLRIVGGDTKCWHGRVVGGERLEVGDHRGIIDYQPNERVISARAGTPLAEIEAELAENGQHLPFEPLITGEAGTLGGAIASGLAGSARPFLGAARDYLLGVTILDGRGRRLRFGGTVFKNVAGFDLFRPMCGALGTLGVILDISLRVAPKPAASAFLRLDDDSPVRARPPITGLSRSGENVRVRLAGPRAAVARAESEIGGEADDPAWWDRLRRLDLAPLNAPRLWRLILPSSGSPIALADEGFTDWGGELIWVAAETLPWAMREQVARRGGHLTLFRGARPGETVFASLSPPVMALHRRLKGALDPAGILNPGRMYEEL